MEKLLKLLSFLGFKIEKGSVKSFTILPFNWLVVVMTIGLAFGILFDSWFVLDKTEKGSVEYFKKFSHEVGPGGFYFKVPFISRVRKVATEVRYRWELGFRTIEDTNPAEFEEKIEEAVMLTNGGHLASVYWIIQYTINDTYNWLYQVKDPDQVIDKLSQGSMRLIVGKVRIDALLTTEKESIQEQNKKLLQNYCDVIGLKVTINEVKLQDCGLPDPHVQEAYNGVMNAIKTKEKMENDAMGYVNRTIPKAKGTASTILNQAKSYYSNQVNGADAEVSRFMGLYEEYQRDPQTTEEKLWYEAMQKVMPNAKKTIVQEKAMLNLKNF